MRRWPTRRSSDLLVTGDPVDAHRPWPRVACRRGRLARCGRAAGDGRLDAARRCWASRRRCTWRCSTRPAARSPSSASTVPAGAFPRSAACIRRRSAWSARSATCSASRPRALPDKRPWLDHGAGASGIRSARSRATGRSRALRVPAGRRRGPAPDPGRAGARRHHRAGPFPLHRQRRDRGAPGGAARLRPQGHRGADGGRRSSSAPRRLAGARLGRQHGRLRARLRPRGRGRARHRGAAARRLAARADGRARADRQPSRRHRRDLQRRRLRADACPLRRAARAGAARRRRLLRPPPDDGPRRARRRRGRSRRRTARGRCARCSPRSAGAFPELVELYDNTASLQDRTVGTGRVCSRSWRGSSAAGGYVGRASGRAFDARRAPGYPPYDELQFEVPVLDEGDVNARVWIRIREVEQSLALIEQILERLPDGPICSAELPARGPREGMALVEGFRGDMLVWLRLDADGTRRALPPARSVLVPVAAARGGDRGQHRRRLPALQQVVQLLLLGPRPLRHACARLLLRKPAPTPPLTERAPRAGRRGAGRARPQRSTARRAAGSAARSSIREVDAGSCNGCELEIHALNNAFYDLERFGLRFVASPRHADVLLVTGPVTKNMREALERTYARHARPEMGGGGRRLRASTAACSPAATPCVGGVSAVVPVDLHIRGCPPTPDAAARGPARPARSALELATDATAPSLKFH